jgi:hypothetical protein
MLGFLKLRPLVLDISIMSGELIADVLLQGAPALLQGAPVRLAVSFFLRLSVPEAVEPRVFQPLACRFLAG